MAPLLSIVIPTLQAERTLGATLDSCSSASLETQIIVSDGGSSDATRSLAQQHDVIIVDSEPGRGSQLATGAAMASGDWLLFLHADSVLASGWDKSVVNFTGAHANKFNAAVFGLRLDDDSPQARRLEWIGKWRTRLLSLPYGDQGLLISRAFYDGLGGYQPMPLMEDVDIIRRIGRTHLRVLDSHITTSAIKYQQGGYWKRPLRNLQLMCLYRLGVSPTKLAELYK